MRSIRHHLLLIPLLISTVVPFSCSDGDSPKKVKNLEDKAVKLMAMSGGRTEKLDSAITLLERAIQLDSSNRTLYTNLATAHRQKGEFRAANGVLEAYEKENSKDTQFRVMKAMNLYCMGDSTEANKLLVDEMNSVRKKLGSDTTQNLLSNKYDILVLLGREHEAKELIEEHKDEYKVFRAHSEMSMNEGNIREELLDCEKGDQLQ